MPVLDGVHVTMHERVTLAPEVARGAPLGDLFETGAQRISY
jgi:hypothetical protein